VTLDVGSVYEATLAVVDKTGAPVSPTTATLTVTRPDQTPYVITETGGAGPNFFNPWPPATTGLVLYDYTLGQEGLHQFDWSTTGPTTHKTEYENARKYVSCFSLAAAKEHLGYTKTDKDERIRTLSAAATRAAERIVGTIVPRAYTGDWVPGAYRPVLRLPHGPALSSSAVTLVTSVYGNGPSWGAADIVVNPMPGTVYLKSLIDFWYGPWKVDYTAGRAVVAEDIVEGALEILRDLFAVARGLAVDVADQQAAELAVSPFYRPPPRAALLLEPHRLPGFA
jgi:hypothetical protein